jgi:hypothetical protein
MDYSLLVPQLIGLAAVGVCMAYWQFVLSPTAQVRTLGLVMLYAAPVECFVISNSQMHGSFDEQQTHPVWLSFHIMFITPTFNLKISFHTGEIQPSRQREKAVHQNTHERRQPPIGTFHV